MGRPAEKWGNTPCPQWGSWGSALAAAAAPAAPRALSPPSAIPRLLPPAAGSPVHPAPAAAHSCLRLGLGCPPGRARPALATHPGLEAEGAGAGARGLRRARRLRPVAGSGVCGVWGGAGSTVGTAYHARTPFSRRDPLGAGLGLGGHPQSLGVNPAAPSYRWGLAVSLDRHSPPPALLSCQLPHPLLLSPTFRPYSCLGQE